MNEEIVTIVYLENDTNKIITTSNLELDSTLDFIGWENVISLTSSSSDI